MRKSLIFLILAVSLSLISTADAQINAGSQDSTVIYTFKSVSAKPTGLFIAPFLGADFPLKTFSGNSKNALTYGARLEFASMSIYPLVLFGQYQFQNHKGLDAYKSLYYLNTMETKISSFGGGFYFLLNKYLKSNFTSPFLVGEVKFYNVKRILSPDIDIPDLKKSESKVIFAGGLGFTLYIFDIITSYNFAGEYSSLSIKTQFHFPLIKF